MIVDVDALIRDLIAQRDIDARIAELKNLDAAAVDRVLVYAQNDDKDARKAAYFALQYCWSDAARELATAKLSDADADVRHMAAIVLDRNEGRAFLLKHYAALIDHPDAAIAGPAIERVEQHAPMLERMVDALAAGRLVDYLAPYLPRYYAPALLPAVRALVPVDDWEIARPAALALINLNDRSVATRKLLQAWLLDSRPQRREVAGEYFCWHGVTIDAPMLQAAEDQETDPHARANLQAARQVIRRRAERGGELGIGATPATALSRISYAGVENLLKRDPPDTAEAYARYCAIDAFEPAWVYQGRRARRQLIDSREQRYAVQAKLFGFACVVNADVQSDETPYSTSASTRLVTPVRDYPFEVKEKPSFGYRTQTGDRAFSKVVHVAEDVGWDQDQAAVVAVADGLIREVSCSGSWGHMLVIEHIVQRERLDIDARIWTRFVDSIEEPVLLADGGVRFCSLYAHLGPFIYVRPGERVTAGQKIAAIGRAHTWENGGYLAHLHFGLHLGPYRQRPRPDSRVDVTFQSKRYRGKVIEADYETTWIRIGRSNPREVEKHTGWLCGYISPWYWRAKSHGWFEPRRVFAALQ